MKLARAIHLDESDMQVFHAPARTGEWAISGGFEFSDWTEGDLVGKARQAFANGWLGLETFGRVTFVAVARIEPAEHDALADGLAQHFVSVYGAPDIDAARAVALEEIGHMRELCEGQDDNTLLTVTRSLTDGGVREEFRVISPQDARLDQIAVHAVPDK